MTPGKPVQLIRASLVNCCSHPIRVFLGNPKNNHFVDIQPSGHVARVRESRVRLADLAIQGKEFVSIYSSFFDKGLTGLPAPSPGVMYIVSRLVAEVAFYRQDLLFPDDSVRETSAENPNVNGIVGCRSFAVANRSRIPQSKEINHVCCVVCPDGPQTSASC